MAEAFDVVVLGAGPGGYIAAIRAAQLGLRTALVEREDLGGVCLNRGCIPSKAMLRSAEVLHLLERAEDFGLHAADVRADYAAVVARRDRSVAQLLKGVTNLLAGNGVEVVRGRGTVRDGQTVEVVSADGRTAVEYRNLIVATGSRSAPLPLPGADLPGVIDSDAALQLATPPRRAVIVGGGAVGVEWAEIWAAFGAEVTVLELLPRLVPTEEPEIARELTRAFGRKGIDSLAGAAVREIRVADDGLAATALVNGDERAYAADTVLAAVGRRANIEDLGLQNAGVSIEGNGIQTDSFMRTNVPNVFAVGDVTGRFLLAHVASHQGVIAAETIAGRESEGFDDRVVPGAIFTHPEIASVGLGEQEAADRGLPVRIGRYPFAASGRAQASGDATGFVKIIAHQDSGEVLGVHIVGSSAGDLIAEACLAMRLHATIDDLAHTIHVHPTFSESIMEAAWVAAGTPIHVPRSRGQGSGVGGPNG
jgi:dihydrolipoamide dehydrogenase